MNARIQRLRSRARQESGLSLIELLIAITITGIIMGPIGFAFYFGLRSTADTQTRLIQSNKANLFASYFSPDVENAWTVMAPLTGTTTATCGAATRAVQLKLVDVSNDEVWYYQGAPGNTPDIDTRALYRRTCTAGALSGPIKVIDSLAAPPTFECRQLTSCTSPADQFWLTATIKQAEANGRNVYPTILQATKRAN